jgi:hypothetical protein
MDMFQLRNILKWLVIIKSELGKGKEIFKVMGLVVHHAKGGRSQ